jgi:Raf kinase inhibitor-like YbhB/YbcL family protein
MEPLTLQSPAFNRNERIPSKYTCDGENLSPPLALDGIPAGTVSLVLIMDDPDSPTGTWDHWMVFNIPPHTDRFGEGEEPYGTPGNNTWKKTGYGGPCPGSGEHRYSFRVYALDATLRLPAGATKADVLENMKGHILEVAELIGRYERQ